MKMLLKRQRRFAILRKDSGFTMVEMLISLVVFMMLAILTAQIFLTVRDQFGEKNHLHTKEWELFTLQLKSEIRTSTDQSVLNNKLYLMTRGKVVTIERYKNIVRRQVDGRGHEIMLQNIADFHVEQDGSAVIVQVIDHEGMLYTRRFYPYLTREYGIND